VSGYNEGFIFIKYKKNPFDIRSVFNFYALNLKFIASSSGYVSKRSGFLVETVKTTKSVFYLECRAMQTVLAMVNVSMGM
jgi:hypothetical protein